MKRGRLSVNVKGKDGKDELRQFDRQISTEYEMRVVVQRVAQASVSVNGEVVGSIGQGLLLLVAFTHDDAEKDLQWMASKVANLRIFDDESGQMNRSVMDVKGEVLAVSQFTLYASTRRGNRPSYVDSAPGSVAEPLYGRFVAELEGVLQHPVQRGVFGAEMQVQLLNDGPVTIIVDSR